MYVVLRGLSLLRLAFCLGKMVFAFLAVALSPSSFASLLAFVFLPSIFVFSIAFAFAPIFSCAFCSPATV